MRSGSEAALAAVRDQWNALLFEKASGEIETARELFEVAVLLRENGSLISSLEDAARDEDSRAKLATDVFRGKVSDEVTEVVAGLSRARWSEDLDLARAIEALGVETLLAGAERNGALSKVEEQLYRNMRTLRNERRLRITLNDDTYDLQARKDLTRKIFADDDAHTIELMVWAVERLERHTFASSLRKFIDAAAERGKHVVASVTSATPLTREQEERLTGILSRMYNKDITLHVAINPAIVGGLRVHVGDDIIDGTLASRVRSVRDSFTN